jgi:hypothetical protein
MSKRHVFGDPNRVGLGANFKKIRANDYFYIDKTSFIEHFLSDTVEVSLICRPRRFGKSLNMDALRCFLADSEDSRELFSGLAVESSGAWGKAGSAPVFHFDFKGLTAEKHQGQVYEAISRYLLYYAELAASASSRMFISDFIDGSGSVTDGLRLLTEVAHEVTGKKSYILIDEYDKLLLDKAGTEHYAGIREFMTYLFSAAFKDNPFLEKGLLTGVMRISYEGLFSGLNNISVYDVLNDELYNKDFGITGEEMSELVELCSLDGESIKEWYDGFSVSGARLYNIFSVCNYLNRCRFDTYWGNSGTMDLVAGVINARRLNTLSRIIAGEPVVVPVDHLTSLTQIRGGNAAFYSLLIQAGYLAIVGVSSEGVRVCVPNLETRAIWRKFIFAAVIQDNDQRVLELFFDRNPAQFSAELEQIMADTLSFWDLMGEHEYVYHVFLLGGLAFSDPMLDKSKIKSNREAGDGRYDIWMERNGKNYIFELKKCDSADELEDKAELALRQIDEKRYGAELDNSKPIWKVGVSCFGKRCKVKCEVSGGPGALRWK